MILNEMNLMSAALEFFAAIVTLVMLLGCFLEKEYLSKTGRLLIWVLAANAAMLLADAPIWLLLDQPAPEKVPLIKLLTFLTEMFAYGVITLYTYCMTAYIEERKDVSYRYARLIAGLCGFCLVLSFIGIFNEMFICYDETGADQNGPLYLLSYFLQLAIPSLTIVLPFLHSDVLRKQEMYVLVLYGSIPVVSIPFQIFWAVTPVYLAFTMTLMLVYTSIHVEQVRLRAETKKKLAENELILSESKNALVLSQIQPHFLYNALTSIYRLCDVKPEAAKDAVSSFSKYLRGNLDSIKQTNTISFADELTHVQAYLTLEKLRYDEYLDIVYDIHATGFFLPPLTVQALVENAVSHGISDMPDGGCVTISTRETDTHYEIQVHDNGIGFDPNVPPKDGRSHVGIQTVRSRLQIMCNGTLEMISAPGKGTTAIVRIPK